MKQSVQLDSPCLETSASSTNMTTDLESSIETERVVLLKSAVLNPSIISSDKQSQMLELTDLSKRGGKNLPLTNLRSLLATAVVLSFFGYHTQVRHLLAQLSRTTRHYSNINSLQGFVKPDPLKARKPSWLVNVHK